MSGAQDSAVVGSAPSGAAGSPAPPRGVADGERSIVAFCCRECAYAAADASANARTPLPPSVRLVLLPCTGRVSPLHLVTALAEGADGVMVAGCLLGQCHYREGNFNAVDRVAFVRRLLESVGVEPERCQMFTMSAGEPPKFVAAVREMDRAVAALPPLQRDAASGTTAGPLCTPGAGAAPGAGPAGQAASDASVVTSARGAA